MMAAEPWLRPPFILRPIHATEFASAPARLSAVLSVLPGRRRRLPSFRSRISPQTG
ncbi:hypothetical protein MASSI9I_20164 [Massilia sp. 9I]|nr:hypothetical protein MASSI9I_20164 [Massilia sp. 9I]